MAAAAAAAVKQNFAGLSITGKAGVATAANPGSSCCYCSKRGGQVDVPTVATVVGLRLGAGSGASCLLCVFLCIQSCDRREVLQKS